MKALVLAGGFPQIALINELKSRNIETVLADYYEAPVAKEYADKFFQISTLDVDAIRQLAIDEKVDFLITACTDQALLTVARVSEDLGLPCYIDYQTALNVTNKQYMKKVFDAYGVPTAKHIILGEYDGSALSGMEYPLIVKPVDCNSSKGVKKVLDEEQLISAFNDAIEYSRTNTAIIEEYVSGNEITVDVQVQNGKAYVLSMAYSDKTADKDKFVIYRTRYPISESSEIVKQISDAAQKIATAFKLENSLMLIQLISDGKRISILEFSARTGGGVKYQLIKKVSGFDVIKAAVDLTINKKTELNIIAPESKFICNLFIYCNEGIFDKLDGFEELKEQGVISDYFLFKWRYAKLGGAHNSGDRIAGLTVQADTYEEIREKYDTAVKNIKVLDINGKDIMRHDLIEPLEY